MLKNKCYYAHELMKDVCFYVLKVQFKDSNRIKLKVRWVTISDHGCWPAMKQRIEIKKDQLNKYVGNTNLNYFHDRRKKILEAMKE